MLEIQIELLSDLVEPHRPRHTKSALTVPVHLPRAGGALVDVPHNLFEEIFERHDTRCSTVFVDDDNHLRPFATHHVQDAVDEPGLGYDRHRSGV